MKIGVAVKENDMVEYHSLSPLPFCTGAIVCVIFHSSTLVVII